MVITSPPYWRYTKTKSWDRLLALEEQLLSNEEKVLKEVYSSFENRMSFEEFRTKFNALPKDKWNFARAVSLFQQFLKCKDCNPNVGMVLLCSCADALQLKGGKFCSKANFIEFYLKYCPHEYRLMPIEHLSREKRNTETIPFDKKTLDYIYQTFRCSYVHVGIGNLMPLPKNVYSHHLLGRFEKEKDFFMLDLVEFPKWFEKITFESLYEMLIATPA